MPLIPDAKTRKRLWRYVRPYWKLELLLILVMVVLTALVWVLPQAIRYLIDDLIPGLGQKNTQGQVDFDPAIWFGLALAGIYAASFVFSLARDYLAGKLGASIIADMRSDLFGHLAQVPLRFFQTSHVGEIMSRLMADVQRVQNLLTVTFSMFLTNVLLLGSIMATLFYFNWTWGAMALIPVPVIVWLSHR